MRVLYLLNYAGNGGTEAYVKTLIDHLTPQIEPYFIYSEPGALVEWMAQRKVPTIQIAMNSPFDRKAARAIAAQCKEWGVSVIHTHFLRENYIAMLAKSFCKGLKVINTYHILTPVSPAIKLCNRLIAHRQDAVIANCTAGRELLISTGVPAKKIHLIYNAVDPTLWEGGDGERIRRELEISDSAFLMLFAARLVAGKGHTFLMDAVEKMEGDVLLLLPGEGELDEQLHRYAAERGLENKVRFLGHRTDMKDLYAAADLTVCPSESETLSFLLLESLAAGTPVVATRVGGLTDIVTPETNCGLLVEYGDVPALTDALEHMRTHPEERKHFSDNGKQAIAQHFHIDALVSGVLSLYQN